MGAANALAAYRLYAGKIPQTSMVVLTYMALVTLDRDTEPSWWEGHDTLAVRCFGYPEPVTDAGLRAVRRAVTPLFKAGAITVTRHATGRRLKAGTVRYRLWLDQPAPDEKRPTNNRERRTKTVLRTGQRRTKNGPTPDEKRPSKETGGGTNNRSEIQKVLTSPVPVEGGHGGSSQNHQRHENQERNRQLDALGAWIRDHGRDDDPDCFGRAYDDPRSPWPDTIGVLGAAVTG